MYNKDKFQIDELVGRQAFKELIAIYKPKNTSEIKCTNWTYSSYDMSWEYEVDGGVTKTVLVEIKIRYATYPDYILQDSKFRGMDNEYFKKGVHRKDVTLLYVNFCPEATYIWDITKANERYKTTYISCPKTTRGRNREMVDTAIYLLPTADAQRYKYVIDKNSIIENLKKDKVNSKLKFD